MLLAVDVGNTNVVFALFEGRTIKARWRIATDPRRTGDQRGNEQHLVDGKADLHATAHRVTEARIIPHARAPAARGDESSTFVPMH